MGYQPTINLEKDKNGVLLADSPSNLNRWKNYFCYPLNIHAVNHVRRTEMHTAEPLVPEPSPLDTNCYCEAEKM
jgi:hypothetical protein